MKLRTPVTDCRPIATSPASGFQSLAERHAAFPSRDRRERYCRPTANSLGSGVHTLALLPLLAASLTGQTLVDGRVFDSVTGAPVSNAYIISGNNSVDATTDSAGHFRVESRNNQAFVLVKHNGYLDHRQGFEFHPGQAPSEIHFQLIPQAVISGHVFDENGLPVCDARVSALQYREVNGERRLRPWRGSRETNELGEYRISELPPGRYYLGVAPGKLAEWDPRYIARLYPDETQDDRAEPVDVSAGEERSRDFRLTRQDGVTVAGRLVRLDTAPGKRTAGDRVTLHLQSTEQPGYSIPVKQSGDSFSIAHVPAGNYTLRSWANMFQPRIGDLLADLTLQVGTSDMRDLQLEVRPIEEQDVSGTIVFLGRTRPGPMAITLRRELGDAKSAVSNADGSFVVKGILPGHYYLDVRGAAAEGVPGTDGYLVSAQLGARDISEQSFDVGTGPPGTLKIAVAAPVTKLTGKLLDAAGRPVYGASILLLSQSGIRSIGYSDHDGTIAVNVLTTGEHRVFAVSGNEEFGSFRDPDFLQRHQNDFPPVQIADGANPPLVLRQH